MALFNSFSPTCRTLLFIFNLLPLPSFIKKWRIIVGNNIRRFFWHMVIYFYHLSKEVEKVINCSINWCVHSPSHVDWYTGINISGWQNVGKIILSMDVVIIKRMSQEILTSENWVRQKNWAQKKIPFMSFFLWTPIPSPLSSQVPHLLIGHKQKPT